MPRLAQLRKTVVAAIFFAGAAFLSTAIGDRFQVGVLWRVLAAAAGVALILSPWLRSPRHRAFVTGIVAAVIAVRMLVGLAGYIRSWTALFLWAAVGLSVIAFLTADQEIKAKAKLDGDPGATPP